MERYTYSTQKGPSHLESSLPGENLKRDLNNKTLSPTLNSHFRILLSCHFFTFSLNILALSKASLLHSSREVKFMRRFSLANFGSAFNSLTAQKALCSNSNGKWQALP